ncbi:surface lipoprotein assembly modifier [Avibacterium sp. 21-595]|uniref:surface lipoprotein assembly modifier n=1 Tax=Avibacterium sp. 21-595 TaxID=2911527 RepID=UPI002026D590|nr:surface lipoprotein assembly modifier [Avibacterium sp. 21-595]URL07222.1 surface lipoprotein assembly modifier [Avibacterium sp. 21-595]
MKKLILIPFVFYCSIVQAENTPALNLKQEWNNQENYFDKFKQSELLTRQALQLAIRQRNSALIQQFLPIYQQFKEKDPAIVQFSQFILAKERKNNSEAINILYALLEKYPNSISIRLELAILLFWDQQLNLAKQQFKLLKHGANSTLTKIIDSYLTNITEKESLHSDFNFYYLRTKNINKVSSASNIENTRLIKKEKMLPQSAHGIGMNGYLSQDKNIVKHHYLAFKDQFFYKYYWDRKEYNDAINRLSLGYKYKEMVAQWQVFPFYELRWVGNKRYQRTIGANISWENWLTNTAQIRTELEYSKNDYVQDANYLDGHNKFLAISFSWLPQNTRLLSLGLSFRKEKTQLRYYDNDTKAIRFDWLENWKKSISSQINFSYSYRRYKDKMIFARILPLNKIRKDHIYSLNLLLWKRDLKLLGFIPKIQFSWVKQQSNLPTLYSYSEKNINIFFEKGF